MREDEGTVRAMSVGGGGLTCGGKNVLADLMYQKGCAFLGAGALLRREHGDGYVALHLLCQGYELILKALLLKKDHDHYWPRIAKKPLRHDLVGCVAEVCKVFGVEPLRGRTREQLAELSRLFGDQSLRYASLRDIFIDAGSLDTRRVERIGVVFLRALRRDRRFEPPPWVGGPG